MLLLLLLGEFSFPEKVFLDDPNALWTLSVDMSSLYILKNDFLRGVFKKPLMFNGWYLNEDSDYWTFGGRDIRRKSPCLTRCSGYRSLLALRVYEYCIDENCRKS